MIEDCRIHPDAVVYHPEQCNLYGCEIGAGTTVGPFVEIQRGAVIGSHSKICSHAFICHRVTIGDRVFVGHGVMFCNDWYPVIDGPTVWGDVVVEDDVAIGSGAAILPVRIGAGAIVGAGAVVVDDVPALAVVVGNPAIVVRRFSSLAKRNEWAEGRGAL